MVFRPLSPTHTPSTAPRRLVRNRSIITDPYTTIACSLLAAAIFATLLEFSFATFLPVWLINHFDHIRDLRAAHLGASGLPLLLVTLLPAGYAAMQFIFAPSTAAPPTKAYVFDTTESGFIEHVYHNAWGWYSNRERALISRTVLLAGMIFAESVIQTWGTIAGVELFGAVGYAGIWTAGVLHKHGVTVDFPVRRMAGSKIVHVNCLKDTASSNYNYVNTKTIFYYQDLYPTSNKQYFQSRFLLSWTVEGVDLLFHIVGDRQWQYHESQQCLSQTWIRHCLQFNSNRSYRAHT
jgi:hypothetical protein